MKEYKVGDTIYVKDTVTDIDGDDSTATYYGNHHGWLDNSCIIDGLPAEPVKPVLPKAVADELDIAKNDLQISFDVYIGNIINRVSSAKASYHYYIFNTNSIIKLADAWRCGYTVEKPKRYVLPMPGTGCRNYQMHGNAQYYAVKRTGSWRPDAIALGTDDAVKRGYTVTQSDIDTAPAWVKAIKPFEVTDDEQ